MFSKEAMKKYALSWAMYFAFGRQPNWQNKDQVRLFLENNQYIIVWLVNLLNLQLATSVNNLYGTVINNKILFDVFYDSLMALWINPLSLVSNEQDSKITPIDIKEKRFIDRLRERVSVRRAQADTPVMESLEAGKPESLEALGAWVGALSSLAAFVLYLRRT